MVCLVWYVLLLLGGFGNIATILVLWRMKRSPSTQPLFLMAVAISDLCLLYSGLFLEMCLYLFHLDLKNMHSVPCTGFLWLSLAANSTSAWLLVTVTAQRAVCVALPYRMRSLFSRRRSEFAIAAVAAAAAILHSHVFYGMHVPAVNPGHCTAAEDYHHFWDKVWSWIDLCVSSLIPSLILFCCNLFLIWALRRRVRSAAALSEGNAPGMDARRKAASSTTITVLLLSFTFLVLTIPYYAFLIWSHPVNEESAPELQARVKLIWTVTSLMWYGNSAVNFLLYCVSGSKFRAEFLRWLRCSSTQDTPSNSGREPVRIPAGAK
nr:hypothetical protein BaRGS_006915 [Batillaria attramentaria]